MNIEGLSLIFSAAAVCMKQYLTKGKTLVPVRFVADCFGVKVDWDGTMQRVSLIAE